MSGGLYSKKKGTAKMFSLVSVQRTISWCCNKISYPHLVNWERARVPSIYSWLTQIYNSDFDIGAFLCNNWACRTTNITSSYTGNVFDGYHFINFFNFWWHEAIRKIYEDKKCIQPIRILASKFCRFPLAGLHKFSYIIYNFILNFDMCLLLSRSSWTSADVSVTFVVKFDREKEKKD